MVYQDGDVLYGDDLQKLLSRKLENQIQIIRQEAGQSLSLYDWDKSFGDTFSDSTGYFNTVDTGNTTAIFDTNKYTNGEIDISTASYDNKSFSVGSQDTVPMGLFFKSDGTKVYIVGSDSDKIYQYSLSTAWDISTASYDNKSFSVGSQDISPTGLFFRPDGTKVYIVGAASDKIHQYSTNDTALQDKVVQTNSKTISGNIKSVQVTALKTTSANASVTVDISTDGGSTWDATDQSLDTMINCDEDNTSLVLKFNLNAPDTESLASIYGYAVQVWTS